jgi:hypothetical protein
MKNSHNSAALPKYDTSSPASRCRAGTYTTDYNNLPACIPCPSGTTTVRDNSTSPAQCKLARKGFYLKNATAAEECPLGSYQGREAEVYKCDECPYGEAAAAASVSGRPSTDVMK